MKYFTRTEKYQKYVNGVPTDEFKEGESIGVFQFGTMNECEKDTPQITYNNWVAKSSDVLQVNKGFTINSLGTGDDGYYHFTIEGAGTSLKFKPDSLIYSHYVDLTNVTFFDSMFINNYDYIGGNFTGWNTPKVEYMNNMFLGCEKVTTLDLSSFNTSKVTDMMSMFQNCNSLTTLDLSHFDTSKVTDIRYMFNSCSSLTTLNISGWDLTKAYNDNNVNDMFIECASLQTIYAHGCNELTINCINEELSKAGLTNQVTIITQ